MVKRPVLQMSIAFGTGILAAWYIRQVFFFMVIFFFLMLLTLYGVRRKIPCLKNLFLWGILLLCGYLNYAFQFTNLIAPLQSFYETEVVVTGYVNSPCAEDENRTVFDLFVEKVNTQDTEKRLGRSIRISVYNAPGKKEFTPGRRLSLTGTLRKPNGSRNPGGFNYESYLFAQKVPATISVNMDKVEWGATVQKLPFLNFGLKAREAILNALERNLSGEKTALMGAMLTGYRENLTGPMEEAFTASGLTHILAVSGANVAFLLFPLLWLFRMLGFDRRLGATAAIPLVFLYLMITGIEPSVLRASIMALVVLLGKVLDRKPDLLNSIGIASLLVLFFNPFMLFDSGFQLSVGATAGLALLYQRVLGVLPKKFPAFIRETLAATIAAQAGVLPILIHYFSKVSVISLLSNLIVVPITGVATVLGMICVAADSLHAVLGSLAGSMLQGILHIILLVADTCAAIPWAQVNMHHWSVWWITLYYTAFILAALYGTAFFRRYIRCVFACAFLIGAVLLVQSILPNRLKVVFTDVGQGDSALIQTPEGKNYLVDGGGANNEDETGYIGRQVLIPLLMHEGVSRLEQVIVSHAHTDHMSGVLTLLKHYPVKSVGLPEYPGAADDFSRLISLCGEKETEVFFYSRGDRIEMDSKTTFDILYPDEEFPPDGRNLNNTSLCGLLTFAQMQVLFTGDMEREAEKILLGNNHLAACDVLKVAHHGGKNGTSEQFLAAIDPEVAVISVGRNSFGHPSQETLDRLSESGSKVYTTVRNGAIIVDSDGIEYRVKLWYRDEQFTFLNEHDRLSIRGNYLWGCMIQEENRMRLKRIWMN